jgi:hypothetical protein
MKFSDYQSRRDQYDRKYPLKIVFKRKYPLKIVFKEGKTVYGHTVSYMQTGDKTTNIIFAVIANIDDWCKNINEENRERIKFDDDVIDKISIFKDY